MKDCVVIGIGNTLMKDDGVGVHAVRYIRDKVPRGVTTIEGAVYSIDMISYLEGYKKVLFIDGIDAGDEPGAIFRFSPEDLRSGSSPVSVHELGPLELIRDAKLLGQCPEEVVVYTVQIKELGLGEGLSPEVERALPRLAELINKEIEAG